jgi:hypothetical protein
MVGLPPATCPQPAPLNPPGYYCPTVLAAASAAGWTGWNGDPHGIWASPWRQEGQQRLYIGHERPNGGGNRVTVVNTYDPNDWHDDVVEASLTDPIYMKQPIDVVFKALP